MEMKLLRCRVNASMLVLAAGLMLSAEVAAQAPTPATAAPQAKAMPAKPAKKPAAQPLKMVLEPRAMELLKATSARLAAAKTMSFTATVGYEFPSKLGPPIVYSSRYDVTLQRPDKLKIVMLGDGPAAEYYYDGKTIMAYAPAEDLVAIADAPPTIDGALKLAYTTAATYFPFTDLIVADPYAALTDGAKLAFYIGPSSVVGGVKTDMVAWASDSVFLQIWIGTEDKLPRRVRAVFRDDPRQLRHELELSTWKIDSVLMPEIFTSAKAKAGKRMAFANPAKPSRMAVNALGKAAPAKAAPNAAPKPATKPQ